MLARARTKTDDRVLYRPGTGESLPLDDGSVDLVFLSMVFHHLSEPSRVVSECYRVLRSGGVLFVRNGTSDLAASCPYAPFFAGSEDLLTARLPSRAQVRAIAEEGQFRTLAEDVLVQEIAPSYSVYCDKLAAGGDSILAELTPEAFASGLSAVRAHAAVVDPVPVSEPIDVLVFEK
jgi:ubiquinone/menaquinone biosynthesis C-methylase UbiE